MIRGLYEYDFVSNLRFDSRLELVLLGSLWGISYALIPIGLDNFSPGIIVLGRLVLGAITLGIALIISRTKLTSVHLDKKLRRNLPLQALVSSTLPFLLITYGETRTSAAIAGMLNAATPLFTFLFSLMFLPREAESPRKIVGVVIGLVGVVFILSPWDSSSVATSQLIGSLVVLCASGFYAYGFIMTKKYLGEMALPPLVLAFIQISFAAILSIPAVFVLPGPKDPHGSIVLSMLAILVLGVVQTGLATLMYHRIVKALGATVSSFVTYVIPIVAAISGIVILGNKLTVASIIGACVVLGSVALVASKPNATPTEVATTS